MALAFHDDSVLAGSDDGGTFSATKKCALWPDGDPGKQRAWIKQRTSNLHSFNAGESSENTPDVSCSALLAYLQEYGISVFNAQWPSVVKKCAEQLKGLRYTGPLGPSGSSGGGGSSGAGGSSAGPELGFGTELGSPPFSAGGASGKPGSSGVGGSLGNLAGNADGGAATNAGSGSGGGAVSDAGAAHVAGGPTTPGVLEAGSAAQDAGCY